MTNYLLLDIDNTLISANERLAEIENRILCLNRLGKIIIATGRTFHDFAGNLNWMKIKDHIEASVFSNGGEIYYQNNFEKNFFDEFSANKLLAELKDKNYNSTIQTNFYDIASLEYFLNNFHTAKYINRIKILDFRYKEDSKLLTTLSILKLQTIFAPSGELSIFPEGVNKRNAVYKCLKNKADNDRIIACGDGNNDISLELDPNILFIKTKDRGNNTFNYLYSKLREVTQE